MARYKKAEFFDAYSAPSTSNYGVSTGGGSDVEGAMDAWEQGHRNAGTWRSGKQTWRVGTKSAKASRAAAAETRSANKARRNQG
jgi:hypothetical protein